MIETGDTRLIIHSGNESYEIGGFTLERELLDFEGDPEKWSEEIHGYSVTVKYWAAQPEYFDFDFERKMGLECEFVNPNRGRVTITGYVSNAIEGENFRDDSPSEFDLKIHFPTKGYSDWDYDEFHYILDIDA